jgi:zinc transport system substrate-binding protein
MGRGDVLLMRNVLVKGIVRARRIVFTPLVLLGSTFFLLAGKTEEPERLNGVLRTFVSIVPQSYIVERIGGERVLVQVLVQPGQDPHIYEPTPRQMVALNEADILFVTGLPFEEQILSKVQSTNPQLFIAHTDENVERRILEEHQRDDQDAEEHDNHEEHHHGEPDPHIWLGPEEMGIQARNIYIALKEADLDHEELYRKNLDTFLVDLDAVDDKLSVLLTPYRGKFFFVFHPSFGYFADAYGLVQVPIEIEGKSPTPKQIEALIARARKEDVHIIFVQPQFDKRSAEAIAEAIDGAVLTIDPFEKDVLRNLEDIAQKIEGSLH